MQDRPDIQPFEGIRVIDATHIFAGPFATYQLAVMGADVIKVESPDIPDQARRGGPSLELSAQNMGLGFMTQGSNKRAVALDLTQPKDREVLRKLIATADVFVENYRPGALDALGLGYEEARKVNDRIIYMSLSAFGSTMPRREQTAYDYIIQASSGLMAMTGTPEANPIKFGAPVIDYATGAMAAFALASALFQRQRTDRSQFIDMSMFDASMILMGAHITAFSHNGTHPEPVGNVVDQATCNMFATRDGALMLGAATARQYRRLWTALGREDMIQPGEAERLAAAAEEIAVLNDILSERTAEEWEMFFQAHHVPAARVRTMREALADAQLDGRDVLGTVATPFGDLTVPKTAWTFEHGGGQLRHGPPHVGQDTAEIMRELGYSADEVADFVRGRSEQKI